MKVTIIYGNNRHGNTYKAVSLFKEELNKLCEVKYNQYYMPTDLPHFCNGCMTCLVKGRDKCPHSDSVKPIIDSIFNSDGIILASPVYVMDVSGGMKSFLDHLFTMWIPHRPEPRLFDKVGIAISTAAGAGIRSTIKTMTRTFKYLGFIRYFSFSCRVMTLERQENKVKKKLTKKAGKFYKTMVKRKELQTKMSTKMIFTMMRPVIKSYSEDSVVALDKKYWIEKGWLNKQKPWK